MKRSLPFLFALVVFVVSFGYTALVNTTLLDFFLAGSQPNQSGTFTSGCNCHDGYNIAVEPGFNWSGGMMAQAARDPLYFATLAIANQDAAFAGDLCLRCHTPVGWLEGRSVPTDGSALLAKDREGVQCEYCHRAVKPSGQGVNPYPIDASYSSVVPGYASTSTYARDTTYLNTLSPRPVLSGNGMYVVDSDETRRGPRTDADPRHPLRYSPFHRDAALCGTCHDVSNPVFDKQVDGGGNYYYTLNTLNTIPPSFNPYDHFPVERTYSEWLMSSYNTAQGIYAPQFGGNRQYVSTCQDCHMRDVTGKAAAQGNVALRTDLALHDQTGGNTWVPKIVPTFFPTEVNVAALDSAVKRATYMLKNAATLEVTENYPVVHVRVTNETGHKLPSGYPEGRRMWINLKAYDGNNVLVAEFGAYDTATGILQVSNTKVYEAKLAMSADVRALTGLSNDPDGSSFHFALNNMAVKDNRIPPRGFTNLNFKQIQSPPVAYTYADGQYWDTTSYVVPSSTDRVVVSLYYQTTSKEYVEFLRDNNTTNTWGTQLYNAWNSSGKSTPVLMQQYQLGPPLPIQLLSFTAAVLQGNSVRLDWVTLSEINNYGFFVQRRVEGIGEFIDLPNSFIPGHGTTLDPQYYSWTDSSVAPGNYQYRLKQIDLGGPQHFLDPISVVVHSPTSVAGGRGIPTAFALDQNYPNPFNPSTTIRFALPRQEHVRLEVITVSGRQVAIIVDHFMPAGEYEMVWDGNDDGGRRVASGMYLYRLQAGTFGALGKMVLLR